MSLSQPSTWQKLVPLCAFALVVVVVVVTIRAVGDNSGFAPDQPIPFSHRLHAGDNKIPCLYCHANAEKGRHATVPSMNVCMNCHAVVATDRPAIQQLKGAYDSGKVMEWVRVHDLPDYVYFNHRAHVAKGVECQTCHGAVENMERVEQMKTLKMGWCVECHRQKEVSTECSTCHQ